MKRTSDTVSFLLFLMWQKVVARSRRFLSVEKFHVAGYMCQSYKNVPQFSLFHAVCATVKHSYPCHSTFDKTLSYNFTPDTTRFLGF